MSSPYTLFIKHVSLDSTAPFFLLMQVINFLQLGDSSPLSQGQELVGDGDGGSGFRGGWAGWLDTVACERPESGESTGSRVHTQRARDGGSVGAGGATEEERPRWEPKLTAQTLLIHWGFGCLWPPGVYTHLSERSCQLHAVEPPQPQRAAHWAQEQQKKKKASTQSSGDLWPTFNWYEAVFFRHISPDEISIDQNTFSQDYMLAIMQKLQNNGRLNFTSS